MAVAYRSVDGITRPVETIVVPAPSRWWVLVFAVPYLLTYDHAFMHWLAPVPPLEGDGFCGNAAPNFYEHMQAEAQAQNVRLLLLLIAFVAIVFALTTLLSAKTVIVVDRAARILRVIARKSARSVTFAERPVLVKRDGVYMLHAGAQAPIPIGSGRASHHAIDRLRVSLATLDHVEA